MIGIILAAGRGSRLQKLTKRTPKCLIKIDDESLLEKIIKNFKKNKINKIYIVTGYKSKLINFPVVNKICNSKWRSTNIFYSLNCCDRLLRKEECLISYSDIIYDAKCIKKLILAKEDISILSNQNWKSLWKKRFKNPLSDLESFKTKGKYLDSIGDKVNNIKSIEGQFMGLFKIKPSGWKKMKKHQKEEYNNNINKLDITSFFKTFIKNKKNKISVKNVRYFWHEIDFNRDYNLARGKIES